MGLAFSGTFKDTPFHDVISTLRQQQATGSLVCVTAGVERSVYVEHGRIIFGASRDERDRLGEVMVRSGKITRAQLDEALALHRNNAGLKKIGAIFVESGFVNPKELFNGLKLQVRSIIQGLFLDNEGSYRFDETLPPDIIPLQIDMEDLLREVIEQLKQED